MNISLMQESAVSSKIDFVDPGRAHIDLAIEEDLVSSVAEVLDEHFADSLVERSVRAVADEDVLGALRRLEHLIEPVQLVGSAEEWPDSVGDDPRLDLLAYPSPELEHSRAIARDPVRGITGVPKQLFGPRAVVEYTGDLCEDLVVPRDLAILVRFLSLGHFGHLGSPSS
jgi:hypothetical protein